MSGWVRAGASETVIKAALQSNIDQNATSIKLFCRESAPTWVRHLRAPSGQVRMSARLFMSAVVTIAEFIASENEGGLRLATELRQWAIRHVRWTDKPPMVECAQQVVRGVLGTLAPTLN